MAVLFDADTDAYTSSAVPASPWSAAVWVKLASNREYYSTLFGVFNGTGTYRYVATETDGLTLTFFGQNSNATGGTLTVGTWYKVALVVNGTAATLYWAPEGTATLSSAAGTCGTSAANSFRVGGSSFSSENLNGSLAALKVWSAALTKTELEAEFTQQAPVRTSGLYRYHQFLTAPGTADASGNGRSLTAGSTATTTSTGPDIPATAGTTYDRAGGAAAVVAGAAAVSTINVPLPGSVLDLSRWHLTTPADDGGTAEQIDQPALDTYSSEYLEVDEDGFVVFTAPVEGATTSGESGATRSELREHEDGSYDNTAFNPLTTGRRQLTVTCRVDGTSIDGPVDGVDGRRQEVIFFQIHGASGTPPIYLTAEWTSSGAPLTGDPRVRMFVSGSGLSNANLVTGISPTTDITVRCRVEDATLKLWCVLGTVDDLPALNSTPDFETACSAFTDKTAWYHKHGAYNKTKIGVGAIGSAITRTSFLELLQPGDAEPAATYDRAGGAGAIAAGSGAVAVQAPAEHAESGATGAVVAGSGAVELDEPAVLDRAGHTAVLVAGSGTQAVSVPAIHVVAGASAAVAAGTGSVALDEHEVLDRSGGAVSVVAGAGSSTVAEPAVHAGAGSAGAVATGAGDIALAGPDTHTRAGGVAAVASGSGAVELQTGDVYAQAGAGTALVAGSGAVELDEPTTYDRAGAAGVLATGAGSGELTEPGVLECTGGATAVAAGSGAGELDEHAVHSLSGAASAIAVGSGQLAVESITVYTRTGGSAALVAGRGALDLAQASTYARTGGAGAVVGGDGAVLVAGPSDIERTGAGAALAVGGGLVEVIHPLSPARTGESAAVVAGSGSVVRFVANPRRLRAGTPVAVGWLRAGPETVR